MSISKNKGSLITDFTELVGHFRISEKAALTLLEIIEAAAKEAIKYCKREEKCIIHHHQAFTYLSNQMNDIEECLTILKAAKITYDWDDGTPPVVIKSIDDYYKEQGIEIKEEENDKLVSDEL